MMMKSMHAASAAPANPGPMAFHATWVLDPDSCEHGKNEAAFVMQGLYRSWKKRVRPRYTFSNVANKVMRRTFYFDGFDLAPTAAGGVDLAAAGAAAAVAVGVGFPTGFAAAAAAALRGGGAGAAGEGAAGSAGDLRAGETNLVLPPARGDLSAGDLSAGDARPAAGELGKG